MLFAVYTHAQHLPVDEQVLSHKRNDAHAHTLAIYFSPTLHPLLICMLSHKRNDAHAHTRAIYFSPTLHPLLICMLSHKRNDPHAHTNTRAIYFSLTFHPLLICILHTHIHAQFISRSLFTPDYIFFYFRCEASRAVAAADRELGPVKDFSCHKERFH